MRIQSPADLARLIKTRRHTQKLTQNELATAVGITRQSLARIESGNAGASFHTVLQLLDVLGVRFESVDTGHVLTTIPVPDTSEIASRVVTPWQDSLGAQIRAILRSEDDDGGTLTEHGTRRALLREALRAGEPGAPPEPGTQPTESESGRG